MHEISVWTWGKPTGACRIEDGRYVQVDSPNSWRTWYPGRVPALWRRIADHDQRDLFLKFGPLTDWDEPVSFWPEFHDLIGRTAGMWSNLNADGFSLFSPPIDGDRLRYDLSVLLSGAVQGEEIGLAAKDLRVGPRPNTLRASLLLMMANDITSETKFRRCVQCGNWHPAARSTSKFCSNACRQAHHEGR